MDFGFDLEFAQLQHQRTLLVLQPHQVLTLLHELALQFNKLLGLGLLLLPQLFVTLPLLLRLLSQLT